MAEWLLLRLPRSADEPASGVVVDDSGELRTEPHTQPLESFAALAAGRRVAVLVPGAEVLQTSAELPARSAGRSPQIIAFALEEQVAEDIETLHFVAGKPAPGAARTPVDVVARKLLDEWLARLRAAGLEPHAIYADSELLPQVPQQLIALLEEDSIIVRNESGPALLLPADDLSLAFDLAAIPTSPSITQPLADGGVPTAEILGPGDTSTLHLVVYATPAVWQLRSRHVEALRDRFASLKVQLLQGGPLPLFAPQATQGAAINLLQGSYAPARSGSGGLSRWRLAAILAGALIALHILGQGLELRRLHKSEAQLDASITQVFRSSMGEQNPTNARQRMQKRLEGVATGQGGGLLDLLSAVAGAHSTSPATRVEALSFRDGALEMKVVAPDAEAIERINQALRGGGLKADIVAGNPRGTAYEGRVQIKGGA